MIKIMEIMNLNKKIEMIFEQRTRKVPYNIMKENIEENRR